MIYPSVDPSFFFTFKKFIRRVYNKIIKEFINVYRRFYSYLFGSYCDVNSFETLQLRYRIQLPISLEKSEILPEWVTNKYLSHCFNLLGSGWKNVDININESLRNENNFKGFAEDKFKISPLVTVDKNGEWLRGQINSSNLKKSQKIWSRVDVNYVPIDWQRDFKSGYQWCNSTWRTELKLGNLHLVDVKVPWELSRMQHLPQLALTLLNVENCKNNGQIIYREIVNQFLDFIATNPPNYGVNWICPMDVSIRAANWVVGLNILKYCNLKLDYEDEKIIVSSLFDHCRFIEKNLEYFDIRNNHYLADISGLLVTSSFLPDTIETRRWLAFSISEIHSEFLGQFLSDGGNIENSIAYHRLSLEMILYSTALILGMPLPEIIELSRISPGDYNFIRKYHTKICGLKLNELGISDKEKNLITPLSIEFFNKLQNAVNFFLCTLKSDGTFPQIGDNDSGRFLKLNPIYKSYSSIEFQQSNCEFYGAKEINISENCYEDINNGMHVLEIALAFGFNIDKRKFEKLNRIRKHGILSKDNVILGYLFGKKFNFDSLLSYNAYLDCDLNSKIDIDFYFSQSSSSINTCEYKFLFPEKLLHIFDEIVVYQFSEFGLYIFESDHFYLSVRCWSRSGNYTAHGHDDQFSIELDILGKKIICDPGTYVYTSNSEARNLYRSKQAHFSPFNGELDQSYKLHCFEVIEMRKGVIDYIGNSGFAAHCGNKGETVKLIVKVTDYGIYVLHINDAINFENYVYKSISYSPSYGKLDSTILAPICV